MNNYQYPRRRRGGMWIVVLIIVVVVIIYANSKGIINLSSINFGNFSLSGNQSNSAQACVQKVTSCGVKYGYNLTILNNIEVQNSNDANTFLTEWKGAQQLGNISNYNVTSYPIVLVATGISSNLHVFICKSDGNLEETTSLRFC